MVCWGSSPLRSLALLPPFSIDIWNAFTRGRWLGKEVCGPREKQHRNKKEWTTILHGCENGVGERNFHLFIFTGREVSIYRGPPREVGTVFGGDSWFFK